MIRHKEATSLNGIITLCYKDSGILKCSLYQEGFSYKDALKNLEYSVDFGKTWQPCGVLE